MNPALTFTSSMLPDTLGGEAQQAALSSGGGNAGVYWIGTDGKVWVAGSQGTNSAGAADANTDGYWQKLGFVKIADPNPGSTPDSSSTAASYGFTGGGSSSGSDTSKEDAQRKALRGEIGGYRDDIQSAYDALFGNLDALLKARDAELEKQYGDQIKKATEQYTGAIPEIENSYASIGAADSTDTADAKDKANAGFQDTTQTIGKNKQADEAKIGQYGNEQRAKFTADRDSALRNIDRAGTTDDISALRGMRNDIENNLDTAKVTQATLGTDGASRKDLAKLTGDNGRFKEVTDALDSLLKSSMSGAVKQAAVKAVTDSAGLTDEEKDKINQQYGNVYAEQAAL